MPDELALPLSSADITRALAGGKALGLSRLVRAGFPVPPGFVVTTSAYRSFVVGNRLTDAIAEVMRALNPGRPAECEAASRALRIRFEQEDIPPQVAAAVQKARLELLAFLPSGGADSPLAVRSSATAEDLPQASFAGQQETLLNVCGERALAAAVRRCWSSLWTARAIAYRARQGVDPVNVQLAVVVQDLVAADAAGVLFTADPVTGDRGQVVINAAWGLGEAVVSGQVTPDSLVVDKNTGRLTTLTPGDKAVMVVPSTQGIETVPVSLERRTQPVLTPEQAAELARLGREIELLFGAPQDIEWAMADGQAWILQSRPITAAGAQANVAPEGMDDWPVAVRRHSHPFDLWTRVDVGERWPEPVTPLTWTLFSPLDEAGFRRSFRDVSSHALDRIQWTRRLYGRVYLNEGALLHVSWEAYGVPPSLGRAIVGGSTPIPDPGLPRLRLSRLVRHMPATLWLLGQRLQAERAFERLFPRIDAWVDAFQTRDLRRDGDGTLWNEFGRVWLPRFTRAFQMHADVSVHAAMAVPILESVLRRCAPPRPSAQDLLAGLSGVYSAEMILALWEMAGPLSALALPTNLLESPPDLLAHLRHVPEGRPWLDHLEAFLERYGHRCASEAELLNQRWTEAPETVVAAVAGYVRAGGRVNPAAAASRQRHGRTAAAAAAAGALPAILRAPFRAILRRSQHLVRLRDNGQHYVMKLLLPVRRTFVCLGTRWAERGWLGHDDEIFFLTLEEIGRIVDTGSPEAAGLNLGQIVADRRATHARWSGVAAPEVVGPDGRPVIPTPARKAQRHLAGVAASAGRARGPARVVTNLQEALSLPTGSILVTQATDPGWTPVFAVLAGLVLEIGGTLSHGAIVAREYGVPAVVGVPRATERIRDGQLITVNGSAGRVELDASGGEGTQQTTLGGPPTAGCPL